MSSLYLFSFAQKMNRKLSFLNMEVSRKNKVDSSL